MKPTNDDLVAKAKLYFDTLKATAVLLQQRKIKLFLVESVGKSTQDHLIASLSNQLKVEYDV